jgi:hypothetical protein
LHYLLIVIIFKRRSGNTDGRTNTKKERALVTRPIFLFGARRDRRVSRGRVAVDQRKTGAGMGADECMMSELMGLIGWD